MKTFYLRVNADNKEKAEEVLSGLVKEKRTNLEELQENEVLKVIDDSLQSRCSMAKDEVKDEVQQYLLENLQVQDEDEVYQSICDRFFEIADSSTPIYYSDIDGIYYMNGDELEEAYNNSGIGNGNENNHRQVAICVYIEQQIQDYWSEEMTEAVNDYIQFRDGLFEDDISENDEKKLKDYINKSFTE